MVAAQMVFFIFLMYAAQSGGIRGMPVAVNKTEKGLNFSFHKRSGRLNSDLFYM